MSGICGWLGHSAGEEENRRTIARMGEALARFDGAAAQTALARDCGLAVCAPGTTSFYCGTEALAAVCGEAYFTDPDLQQRASRQGIAQTLAELYLERGAPAFAALHGACSAAIINFAGRETALAIDRMGVHSLTYALAGKCLLFGSDATALNAHPLARPQVSRQMLYHYVYFHMVPGPDTVYAGQRRLLPGQCLIFRDGVPEVRPYWEMRFVENDRRSFAELKHDFRAALRGAVERAVQGGTVGAFLSGGTDSSTVSGLIGEVTGEPARTYSIGFDAAGYDEMEYARIAARHFATRHHEYYVTPDDIADAVPRIAGMYDQPYGNSSAVPTYFCARYAGQDGVTRLLGGDGGDELFGGNSRYAVQHVLSLYGKLPAALRKGLIEPLAYAFPGGEKLPPLRRLRGYIGRASIPMPQRLENYNLLERLGPEKVFTADFLHDIDRLRPLALLDEIYRGAHAHSLINHMLALDLRITLADNDLPKVTRMCELAGVGVAFPMLDEEVVGFSARLDPRLKLKGTQLRYFFKQALRGFLPDDIIAKKKHGFGLPYGIWLKTHPRLQQLASDSLNSLARRGVVRQQFIAELTGHLEAHAGYYGTMTWVLMMLELWFQQHQPHADL